jgi:hypothetical protein
MMTLARSRDKRATSARRRRLKYFLAQFGAGTIKAVSFLMIDLLHFEAHTSHPTVQLITMHDRAFTNASADESSGLALGAEYGGDGISTTFADILIAGISAVAAIFFLICWFYVST